MNKNFGCLAFIVMASIFWINFTTDDPRDIPNVPEPIQENLSQKQMAKLKHIKEYGDWKILYIPLASYEISARVLASTPYYFGIDSAVARQDIGVAWGDLYNDDIGKKLKSYHGNRFLYFKYVSGYPFSYVKTHVANIHIVPDNNKILRKIRRVRAGDKIYLKGYLVRAEGLNMKTYAKYERESSLTREDTGNGACETMYVTDVIYHHKKIFGNRKTK